MTLPDSSDDLRLLDDAVARFADRHAAPAGLPGPAPDLWPEAVTMGLVGLALPSGRGGAGLGARGAFAAGRRLGAQGVPLPFVLGAVFVPALLDALEETGLRDTVIAGESRIAVAGDLLHGAAPLAFGPADADTVIGVAGEAATILPLAAIAATGRMADGQPLYHIAGAAGRQARGLASARDAALPVTLVAAAAEALGAMETLFDLTLDHIRLRRQFGRALGSFQTLQFRMVDLSIALEEARALAAAAADALDAGAAEGAALAHAAWVQSVWSGRTLAQEAIQLHGAIGMTAECAVSVPVRRLVILEQLFGGEAAHLARYRALAA